MWWKLLISLPACAAILFFLGWAASYDSPRVRVGRGTLPDEISEHPEAKEPWFRVDGVGCCLDDVVGTEWKAGEVDLTFAKSGLDALKIFVPPMDRQLGLKQSLASFASNHGHLWVVDRARGRFLDYATDVAFTALPGSEDMGSAQALIATPFRYRLQNKTGQPKDGNRLLLTSHPRLQQAAYAVSPARSATAAPTTSAYLVQSPPSDPRSLAEYRPDRAEIRPLLDGLELYAPSGIALSPSGRSLYVADERGSELVWLELHMDDFCLDKWSYRGVLARFPLKSTERGLFRGLLVHSSGMIIGSAPGGLFFYTPDGKQAGKISAPNEITYLIPGLHPGDGKTTTECIYAAIGPRLCYLPVKGSLRNSTSSSVPCEPPTPPTKRKSPKTSFTPRPPISKCCCNGACQTP